MATTEDAAVWLAQHRVPHLLEQITGSLLEHKPVDHLGHLLSVLSPQYALEEEAEGNEWQAVVPNGLAISPHAPKRSRPANTLHIIHFNDVYNITENLTEPKGGAARFKSMLDSLASVNPLILFSGDAFNPSLMSTITKGKQMPPVLNRFGIAAACIGNHDFDFGVERASKLSMRCNFPWILSNAFEPGTTTPLCGMKPWHVLEWAGRRIGLMGLVEEEWMATLATLDPSDITYVDFVKAGRELAIMMRQQLGCELIIALTHMRVPNDTRLANDVSEIDLILGGHDHHYEVHRAGAHKTWLLKSGTDFRNATHLTLTFNSATRPTKEQLTEIGTAERERGFVGAVQRIDVTSAYPPHPDVQHVVELFSAEMGAKMDKVIGRAAVPLDARFQMIRTQETNASNFVADVVCRGLQTDVAIINSGTLRTDDVIAVGDFKIRDLVTLLPMVDALVVLRMTGTQLLEALENGVSQYPRLEGRFPALSGVRLTFDASKPPMHRIVPGSVQVGGEPLVESKKYTVATKEYLAEGKDGFDVFKLAEVVVDAESAIDLGALMRNHFTALSVLRGWKSHRHHVFVKRFGDKLIEAVKQHHGQPKTEEGPESSMSPLEEPWSVNARIDGRITCINGA